MVCNESPDYVYVCLCVYVNVYRAGLLQTPSRQVSVAGVARSTYIQHVRLPANYYDINYIETLAQ